MSLLIQGGEVVTPEGRRRADVLCAEGRILRVGPGLDAPPGADVINASGQYVFPGFVDPHVHVHLPASGTLAKDNYETASRAAVVGGTTCFLDFVIPGRDEPPLSALRTWQEQSAGRSACDFSYHLAVTRYDEEVESQLREIVRFGVPSFKVHLAYKGAVSVDDTALFRTLGLAKELGAIVVAHCENAEIIPELQRRLLARGRTGPEWHHDSRPPAIEADGTHHVLALARIQGAHVCVAHLSCEEPLRIAAAARGAGQPVWIETMVQYLVLDRTFAEQPGFEGAKYVLSPPLRDRANQRALWEGLRDGTISTVGTDHAPFDFATQKTRGRGDFTKIPNGIPGIEDRVNLLYTYGVLEGRLTLEQFVDVAGVQAAKLFGLYPRKGAVREGSDADLVVYDPDHRGTISARTHAMNVDYNPYEGWAIRGRPRFVTVRGEVVVRDGRFVGRAGHGRFVPREPTHF